MHRQLYDKPLRRLQPLGVQTAESQGFDPFVALLPFSANIIPYSKSWAKPQVRPTAYASLGVFATAFMYAKSRRNSLI